jgi:replicative DNA helicase
MVLDRTGTISDEVCRILKTGHLYSDANRYLFDAVVDLKLRAQPTDTVSIANHLRANNNWTRVGAQHLTDVLDAPPALDAASVYHYATIVRDLARVRSLAASALNIATTCATMRGSDPETIQGFIESAEQQIGDIAHADQQSRMVPISDILVKVHNNLTIASRANSTVSGVATGFIKLDAMLTGMHDGDLHIIAGRPGSGKTAFMCSVARKVASPKQGYAVPIFSLEVPAEQLVLRFLAAESNVDMNLLRVGRLDSASWAAVTSAMATLSQLPIFINDDPAATITDMRACVRQLQRELDAGKHPHCAKGRIGFVAIDYLQLVKIHSRGRSREEEIAELSREFKRMAKAQCIPYVVLAQLNREVEKRPNHRPQLSDLRESGSIEADADVVMFVYRGEMYDKDNEELRGVAEIIIGKQRNGPTGHVLVAYKKQCTRFENLDEYGKADSDHDHYYDGFDNDGDE